MLNMTETGKTMVEVTAILAAIHPILSTAKQLIARFSVMFCMYVTWPSYLK